MKPIESNDLNSIETVSPNPSGYRMFSDAQLEHIHLATLEVLRRTGVRVHEKESLELLHSAGCVVTNENLVRFPPRVIDHHA